MYRHLGEVLAKGSCPYELEVSVDETETPTTPIEHLFVASELKRLGVFWVSLAPRYTGRFEKGVDYIGDLRRFEAQFAKHAAVARALGPYKLSLHSGSDKFSIYPIVAGQAGSLVHLKTAGTSYLEALRAVAVVEPVLFSDILTFACQRYEEDRASYHVSADVARVPLAGAAEGNGSASVLDAFDARQVLHVTFGSVLDKYGKTIFEIIGANQGQYEEFLIAHFKRHLAPFIKE